MLGDWYEYLGCDRDVRVGRTVITGGGGGRLKMFNAFAGRDFKRFEFLGFYTGDLLGEHATPLACPEAAEMSDEAHMEKRPLSAPLTTLQVSRNRLASSPYREIKNARPCAVAVGYGGRVQQSSAPGRS